ncbi:LysR family transcriptional regulator [Lactobacillus sp. HT06-2]|uniref:LysR family transcriptional regulator n=1 Tax=Lactobacillus sp. HT06-2 TaxID=2080222 RepID=UPI000CD9A6BA|nr:LysR family transcriptional regulator [Lactobacillus sp. HT06-2]
MYNHEIDTFIAVAKLGSFSEAAKKLYISKAAVAQQINLLEKKLDSTLLVRTSHGVSLTQAGEIFLQEALKIRDTCRHAEKVMQKYRSSLVVGTGYLTTTNHLTEDWHHFHDQNLHSQIRFEQISDYEHLPDSIELIEGTFYPASFLKQGFKFKEIATSPVVIAIPSNSNLAKVEDFSFTALNQQNVLVIENKDNSELIDELQAKAPQVKLHQMKIFNEAAIQTALIKQYCIVVPLSLAKLCDSFVIKQVNWSYQAQVGYYYRTNCSDICRQFLNFLN